MRLLELFTLLELRDRASATAETYQKKLIRRFNTAKEEGKLRGASPRVIQAKLDKGEDIDAVKDMVDYFATGDPTRNNKYLDWIVRQFIKGHLLWEDSNKMRNLLTDFEKYRRKLEKKDLNQYESYHDLEEAVEPLRGTEVAGIRVQNFLKKPEIQHFRDSMVADATHPHNMSDYDSLYGEDSTNENDPNNMPRWFADEVAETAANDAEEFLETEDFDQEARDEIDEDDYKDKDGDVHEEEYEEAISELVSQKWYDAKERYVNSHVESEAQQEWEEYVENNKTNYRSNLEASEHQKPELDVVYSTDRMAVMVPHSEEASCFIGKGTEWCTASEESDNYWWDYTKDGPLLAVITDKLGKFQFHFETSQFMDEHDRYIEDSKALVSLVKHYPKELDEAFGKVAREGNEWWLLPAEEIPAEAWEQMLGQTRRGGIQSEETTRDVVRVWQVHHDKAPEGWADKVRANILGSRQGDLAINRGWFGKVDNQEMDAAIKSGLKNNTLNTEQTAQHVAAHDIEISKESWLGLIMDHDNTLFYAPLELLDRNLLDALMNRSKDSASRGYQRTSFLANFYGKFKQLLGREADPEGEHDSPAPPWSQEGLGRARKIAGMVTMDDIVQAVLKYPDDLTKFEMDFGIKPWLAAANEALKYAGSYPPGQREDSSGVDTVQNFLHRASIVIRQNEDEPWAQPGGELTNLVHQILGKHPEETQSLFRYPSGEMPLDTQNAILDYVNSHKDDKARAMAVQRIGTAVGSDRFSPEAQELLQAIRTYEEPESAEYEKLRKAVPIQQQIPTE